MKAAPLLAILLPILVLPGLAGATPQQDAAAYLHARKAAGVKAAAPVEALDDVVAPKVLEIRGTVTGTFRTGDQVSLLVQRANGDTEVIDAPRVPDWMVGSEVVARLLVRASREDAHASLKATLLAAAPDSAVTAIEEKEWAASVKTAAKVARERVLKTTMSRHGVLRGRIGRVSEEWSLPQSQVTPIYASFIRRANPRLTKDEAMRIAECVVGFSLRYRVDARLVMAILVVESDFDPGSTSHTGAMGLGQLMPDTARWMGVSNPYDMVENLYGTVKLLRTHLDQYQRQTGKRFDALVLALAAYNAGEGAVRRHGGVPPYRETQAYVRRVIEIYYRLVGVS